MYNFKTRNCLFFTTTDHSKDECKDLFNAVKWGCNASNYFFRTVYCGRLWLTRVETEECIYNGWAMCDTLTILAHSVYLGYLQNVFLPLFMLGVVVTHLAWVHQKHCMRCGPLPGSLRLLQRHIFANGVGFVLHPSQDSHVLPLAATRLRFCHFS